MGQEFIWQQEVGGRGTETEEGMLEQSGIIQQHRQSLRCDLLEAIDGQERFLHRAAAFSDHFLVANLDAKPCTLSNSSLL